MLVTVTVVTVVVDSAGPVVGTVEATVDPLVVAGLEVEAVVLVSETVNQIDKYIYSFHLPKK